MMTAESPSPPARLSQYGVVGAWAFTLFAITGIGMLPLFFYRLDLSKLTFSTPVPVVAGIGIELTAYAPTLAALLVAAFMSKGGGLRRLLRPVVRWRVSLRWYLLAILGPSVLFLVGDMIRLLTGQDLPKGWLVIPPATAIAFLVGALIAGSFGEEVGWRGLGQARLQTSFGALWAAVVVGVLWGLWHLWPVVAPGGLSTTTWSDVVLTLVRLVSTSIVYAWLYNSTRGSLLIVMLAHAGHNLAVRFVPLADNVQHGDPVVTGLYTLAAATLVVVTGHRWLSRSHEYPDSERMSPEWSGG